MLVINIAMIFWNRTETTKQKKKNSQEDQENPKLYLRK